MDPKKVKAIRDWPLPRNLKELRSLLGAGYYRRFIRDFGSICQPLIEMLKRDGFMWKEEAIEAFAKLKEVSQLLCWYFQISLYHLLLKLMPLIRVQELF